MRTLEERHICGCFDHSFDEHAEIPPSLACSLDARREILHAPAPGQFPARLPRLRHLQHRRAAPVNVAHTDTGLDRPTRREVLAEGAVRHRKAQLHFPKFTVILGIGAGGFV